MRNVLSIRIEPKLALAIVLVVVAIFLITIFRNINNFNNLIENIEKQRATYEKIRIEKNP